MPCFLSRNLWGSLSSKSSGPPSENILWPSHMKRHLLSCLCCELLLGTYQRTTQSRDWQAAGIQGMYWPYPLHIKTPHQLWLWANVYSFPSHSGHAIFSKKLLLSFSEVNHFPPQTSTVLPMRHLFMPPFPPTAWAPLLHAACQYCLWSSWMVLPI